MTRVFENMNASLYHYKAEVTSVYDGDTCTVNIDLGLKTWVFKEKLRLYGINAPEVRGKERPKGLKARDFLRDLINGKEVVIETRKDKKGKYGRYLGTIWLENEQGEWININEEMVNNGHAEWKDY